MSETKRHVAQQYNLNLAAPSPALKKPRYSYSQVETAKCGARYKYMKDGTIPRELTYQLAAGTITDLAFNSYYYNNEHLVETHQQRMDYARAAVELAITEHPDWTSLEWSTKAGDVRSSPENFVAWLFDLGALELVCRHDRGPVEVQKKVELDLPNYSIVGYIDCIELDTNTIIDIKAVTGWNKTTQLSYALRSQVPLYRMLLKDTTGVDTKGRYELLLCRKKPSLITVVDMDLDFLQEKLLADFNEHHRKISKQQFTRNPERCLDFNRTCGAFNICWPSLSYLNEQPITAPVAVPLQ